MNINRTAIIVLAVAAVGLLAGCGGSQDASTTTATSTTATTHATETRPTPMTTATTTAPATPVDTRAADQATCTAFEDQIVGTGLQEQLAGTTPPAFNTNHFVPIPVAGSGTVVHSAVATFNAAVAKFNAAPLGSDESFKGPIIDAYNVTVSACQGLIVPKPAVYSISCYDAGYRSHETFTTYEEAWGFNSSHCTTTHVSGTQYTGQQHSAVQTAYGSDKVDSLKTLYELCSEINAYPAVLTGFASGHLSASQLPEAQGMLILCPDHPQAAAIQANIDAAGAAVASSAAHSQAVTDGHYAAPGHYLVGTDIQPGTCQSVGTKVTDCYWEISDASGNIIDNNFISVAPQFTITIPSDAAGFTNTGCAFEWIGE